jgi:hypothetical protein
MAHPQSGAFDRCAPISSAGVGETPGRCYYLPGATNLKATHRFFQEMHAGPITNWDNSLNHWDGSLAENGQAAEPRQWP